MKIKIVVVLLGLLVQFFHLSPRCSAKAAYRSKTTMIHSADVIVFADIKRVEKVEKQGKHWKYRQKAVIEPIKMLKGKLPANAKIFGGENFICAQVNFKPGKALLFLKKSNDYYVGNNWHLSVRSASNGKIEWFAGSNVFGLKPQEKSKVFADVKNTMKEATNKNEPSYIKPLLKAKQVNDELIGEGGAPSQDFKIFKRALLDKNISLPFLKKSISQASASGKIYMAMIMMKHYPKEAKSTLQSLKSDQTKFDFQSGCEILSYSVNSAAKELLEKGNLLGLDPNKIK